MTIEQKIERLEIVGKRWRNIGELEEHLNKIFAKNGEIVEIEESGLVGDYALLYEVGEDMYMDIYFLRPPVGEMTLYITEISVM